MSFICGAVFFRKETDDNNIPGIFEAECRNYKTEPFRSESMDEAAFGCGIQRFSRFSGNEVLPIRDSDKGILFVADCIIDNRSGLAGELNVPEDIPDGKLLYESYLKWGTEFESHVCGSFCFAAYHENEKKLILCSDHMNTRSLYYHADDKGIVFSNSAAPLARACDAKPSEKWAAACLYNISADLTVYDSLTPYEGILQVKPAHVMIFRGGKTEEHHYWDPLKFRIDRPEKTEEEYRELFVNTFKRCVSEMLRTEGKKGCTLSGGLDSTSVAALASRELADEKLYSFTSVPEKEYDNRSHKDEDDGHSILNESDGVRQLCGVYENISPEFVDCSGQDSFSELRRLIPLIGFPMKSGLNLTWLDGIYSRAEQENIRLILKGQFGNSTISHGNILTVFYQYLAGFKPKKALNSAKRFAGTYHVSKKIFAKVFFREMAKRFSVKSVDKDCILTDKKLAKRYGTGRDTRRILRAGGGSMIENRRQRLMTLYDPIALNQLGMFDTIMGLIHGIIIRDPTKDKRMVELCGILPPSCMAAGGWERGQVRKFMEGYVPETILKDVNRRGLQSADYYFRIRKNWNDLKSEVIDDLSDPELMNYADKNAAERLLSLAKECDIKDIEDEDLRKMNVLCSFSIFLRTFEQKG